MEHLMTSLSASELKPYITHAPQELVRAKDSVTLSLLYSPAGMYFGSMGCGNLRCASDMLISLNGSLTLFPNGCEGDDFKLHVKCLAPLSRQPYLFIFFSISRIYLYLSRATQALC